MQVFFENLGLFIILLMMVLGYGFGRLAESRHYKSIRRREAELSDLIVVAAKTVPVGNNVPETRLVMGSAVISVDYFKQFVAGLRKLFGGRIHTYESLIDRARREAMLRMQEEARKLGAGMIFNTRFETASISKGGSNAVGSIEVLAYGTAIVPAG